MLSTVKPHFLAKATSSTPCSLAQLRLAAEAKPPSQALWRGTARTARDDALRRVGHSCYRPGFPRSTTQSRISDEGTVLRKTL